MNVKDILEKKAIIRAYYYRIIAKKPNFDINIDELFDRFLKFDTSELHNKLYNIINSNIDLIAESLNNADIKVSYYKDSQNKPQNLPLHSPSITQFTKDEKNYLKFKNKKGNIKVFEIFENVEKTVTNILNKNKNDNEFIEIPLINYQNINKDTVSKTQLTFLDTIKNQFKDNDLYFSAKEQIYVATDNLDDTVLTINNNKNNYKVFALNQTPYQKDTNTLNSKNKIKSFALPNAPKLIDDELTT